MVRKYGRFVALAGAVVSGLGPSLPAEAQVPEKLTNLQVLPKDTARPELVALMRSYASALGVRCEQCHVGAEAPDFKGTDFASDAKESKRTARLMMKMVRAINEESLPRPASANATRVECVTCHRGQKVPRTLDTEITEVLEQKGAPAAVARYRELRAAWFGRGGYDFGQGALNQVGERLLKAGRAADALALLDLNLEFFPEAPWTQYLAGEAHRALGQTGQARAAYERSAALGPDNPMPRQRLQALPPLPAEPDFKNVRHFTGLTPPELQRTMNFMRASLGVHCDFCHVVTKEAGWQWEKDDKPAKQTARKMIEMVEQLNRDRFAGQTEVSCYTCHRGHQRPLSQPPLPQPPPPFPTVAEAAPLDAPPSAESVWQRFRETVHAGPRPATRVLKGQRVGGKESSDLEIREKGDRALILVTGPRGRLEQALDGGEGWIRDEKDTRALTADERANLRDILGTLAFPPDEPRGAKVVAKEAVDGREAWVLEWMPAPGRTQRLYFDAQSGLLARREELTRRKVGWVPERIDYADYRDVGGTKVPATIKASYMDPWIGATRTFTEIQLEVSVDDAVFARPKAAPSPGK